MTAGGGVDFHHRSERMKKNEEQRAAYVPPTITDFGKVSLVTAAVGMTFTTDSNFNGSMEFPGGGAS